MAKWFMTNSFLGHQGTSNITRLSEFLAAKTKPDITSLRSHSLWQRNFLPQDHNTQRSGASIDDGMIRNKLFEETILYLEVGRQMENSCGLPHDVEARGTDKTKERRKEPTLG